MKFSFRIIEDNYYPIIDLIIENKDKKIRTHAIVDTGASISIFRSEIAETIGINLEDGEKRIFQGASSKLVGYVHEVKLTINNYSFRCKMAFSDDLQTGLNLLGRESVFDKFILLFNEKEKFLEIKEI